MRTILHVSSPEARCKPGVSGFCLFSSGCLALCRIHFLFISLDLWVSFLLSFSFSQFAREAHLQAKQVLQLGDLGAAESVQAPIAVERQGAIRRIRCDVDCARLHIP